MTTRALGGEEKETLNIQVVGKNENLKIFKKISKNQFWASLVTFSHNINVEGLLFFAAECPRRHCWIWVFCPPPCPQTRVVVVAIPLFFFFFLEIWAKVKTNEILEADSYYTTILSNILSIESIRIKIDQSECKSINTQNRLIRMQIDQSIHKIDQSECKSSNFSISNYPFFNFSFFNYSIFQFYTPKWSPKT